ncbi:MAG: DUF6502 family protein, partial [Pseudomonadota bacterium]
MKNLQSPITKILRPIIRVLIARGILFPELSDWLKELYLTVAENNFRLDGKRVTDSRLHLLTGLQRKDIKAIRGRMNLDEAPMNAGPVSRVVGRWLAEHSDPNGIPLPLNRLGQAPSFQAIVQSISLDMHLRTVQDELARLGLADVKGDQIHLTSDA